MPPFRYAVCLCLCAVGLCVGNRALSALELPPDTASPQVVPTPPARAPEPALVPNDPLAPPTPPVEISPAPEPSPAELEPWPAQKYDRENPDRGRIPPDPDPELRFDPELHPYHWLSAFASAHASYFGRDNSSQSSFWQGAHLPQLNAHRLRAIHAGGRAYFRTQARHPDHRAEPMQFAFVDLDDLHTLWRDGANTRFDLRWQSVRSGLTLAHAGIHSWMIPAAGIASAVDAGLAWDHLTLQIGSAPARHRDGLRFTLGLLHLNGVLWSDNGFSVGVRLNAGLGLGGMARRGYGTAEIDIEPRLGMNFIRSRAAGGDIPFGGIYVGAKSGGRWLTTFGRHPTQLQNAWLFQPTLTAVFYF